MNMNDTLRRKYRTYTERQQYSYGRRHNGNGRSKPATPDAVSAVGRAGVNLNLPAKTMYVDGLTGKSVMA